VRSKLDPTHPNVLLWVGWALAWFGRPEEGVSYVEQAAALNPNNSTARHGLGAIYGMLNQLDDGLAELRALEMLTPQSPTTTTLIWYAFIHVKAGGWRWRATCRSVTPPMPTLRLLCLRAYV
jgi:hypothetical protein